jgi:hypothetical protein
MEFQVTVTIADHGHDPACGEKFLTGFWETHPEVGAVVDQNVETGELSVTFGFDAPDLLTAGNAWLTIFIAGAEASGLPATRLKKLAMAAEVSKIKAPSRPRKRTLVAA